MEHFKKLMEKKRQAGKGSLEPVEASARHSVLNDMIGALDQDGLKKVKNLKKVTVASNDKKGLEKGLEKAKELVAHEGEMTPDSQEEEYDDQDAEGPNHIPTEKEASSFGAQDPKLGSPEVDGEESMDEEASEESEFEKLKAEHEKLKAEIERLKAPKSFY